MSHTVDMDAIQNEQAEWAEKNFGAGAGLDVVLGVIEEVGELASGALVAGSPDGALHRIIRIADFVGMIAHHTLKCRQGIRGDEEHHDSMVISLTEQLYQYLIEPVSFAPSKGVHERVTHFLSEDEARDAVGDILIYLMDLCERNGWSMADILESTWEEVKQRDWVENPEGPVDPVDEDQNT